MKQFAAVLPALLLYWLVTAIGLWRVFAKADRPGWWGLIPLVRLYGLYAIAWETKIFWYQMILIAAVITVLGVKMDMASTYAMLMSLAAGVMAMILPFRLAKTFGKDVFFGIGLLLFGPIFLLILGFDGSKPLESTGSGRRLG